MAPVVFDLATVLLLVWTVVLLPFLAWLSNRHLAQGKPLRPKSQRLYSAILVLTSVTLPALIAANTNRIQLVFATSAADVIAGLLASAVFVFAGWRGLKRSKPAHLDRIRLLYAPQTSGEWRAAVLCGLCAGICEEIIYRGVLFALALRVTSSMPAAIAICVLLFALAHLPQGKKGMIGVAYLGVVFHALYLISGTLALPMMVHATYDIVFFWILYRRERSRECALVAGSDAVEQVACEVQEAAEK